MENLDQFAILFCGSIENLIDETAYFGRKIISNYSLGLVNQYRQENMVDVLTEENTVN